MREQLVKLVDIIPIEFVVRNIATGSLTKRLGIEDGTVLERPLIEYCLKDDKLGDPIISREHILTFNWLNINQLDWIDENLSRLNDFLLGMFRAVGIKLVDFKVEFYSCSKKLQLCPTCSFIYAASFKPHFIKSFNLCSL